jgi:DeoR family transcriptional regulator of aga operon
MAKGNGGLEMNDQGQSKGDKRRNIILSMLKLQGKITIFEIIEKFNCSEATARRDLDLLEKQGNIIRSFGGAQLESISVHKEVPFHEKKQMLWLEKEAIAAKAASLVEEGDVVALTGGTTTFLIARALKLREHITVVTNAVNIAMELSESQGVQVVLTGGVMRRNSFELCGPLAETIVENLNINIMFMGIDGITAEQGLTTFSELEADIARLMMKRSGKTIAVFDHSKAGRSSLFSISALTMIQGCITNRLPNQELLDFLNQQQIPLYIAEAVLIN